MPQKSQDIDLIAFQIIPLVPSLALSSQPAPTQMEDRHRFNNIESKEPNEYWRIPYRKVLPCQGLTIKICMSSMLEAVSQYIQVIFLQIAINRPKTIYINAPDHTRSKPHEFVTCVKYDLKGYYVDLNVFSRAIKVWCVWFN